MGIPIICNSGVGDVEKIIADSKSGVLINKFTEIEFKGAIKQVVEFAEEKNNIREKAINLFSLNMGVELYDSVYKNL